MNRRALTASATLGLAVVPVVADPITHPSQLNPTNTVVDFEAYPAGVIASPLVAGRATFSSTRGLSIINIAGYGANGTTVRDKTLNCAATPGFSHPFVPTRIDFDPPVREVGLGWFDPNFPGNYLRVYNCAGTLLEEMQSPTGSPGGGFASFVGIRRPVHEIAYALIVPAATNEVYTIDNVSFSSTVQGPCYADCDDSPCPFTLDVFDFLCFQNLFDNSDPYACDCDTGSGPGVCDIFDFLCFQNAFAAGCP